MSGGFGSGGLGNVINDLLSQLQTQNNGPLTGGTETNVGDGLVQALPDSGGYMPGGWGEPQNLNYGNTGMYNTLSRDMSRGFMGPFGFGGGQFSYSPFGNPFMQPPMVPPSPPIYPNAPPIMGGGFGGWPGSYGGMPSIYRRR